MSARRDKLLSLFYPRRSTTLPFLLDRVLELHSHCYRTRGSFVRSFVRLAINTFLSHMLAPWKLGNLFLFARKGNRKSNATNSRSNFFVSSFRNERRSLDINQGDLS